MDVSLVVFKNGKYIEKMLESDIVRFYSPAGGYIEVTSSKISNGVEVRTVGISKYQSLIRPRAANSIDVSIAE